MSLFLIYRLCIVWQILLWFVSNMFWMFWAVCGVELYRGICLNVFLE